MNDLADTLRTAVDAVPPVTLDEVTVRPTQTTPDSGHRSLPLVAAVACAVAVLVVGVITFRGPDNQPAAIQAGQPAPSTSTPTQPLLCAPDQPLESCPLTSQRASEVTGFATPEPTVLPAGWARATLAVIDYPARTNLNPADQDLLVLKQIWQPPGTDRTDDRASWASLDLRRQLPTESATKPNRTLLRTLDDGTQIYGSSGPATVGADPATSPVIEVTQLQWTRQGLTYRFTSHGLTRNQALDLVGSLI